MYELGIPLLANQIGDVSHPTCTLLAYPTNLSFCFELSMNIAVFIPRILKMEQLSWKISKVWKS